MNLYDLRLFQLRAKPGGNDRTTEFLTEGYVCIGWREVPDMTKMGKEDIRFALENAYNYSGRSLSTNLGTVNTFRNVMRNGDLVLMAEGEGVHIGVVGDYFYEESKKTDDTCHRRLCVWKKMVKKDELNEEVRALLRNMTTITKFKYPIVSSGIPELLNMTNNSLHKDINKNQQIEKKTTEKMGSLFDQLEKLGKTALSILEEELASTDPDRRLKAAVDVLAIMKKSTEVKE
ncbi:hypothetical protein [Gottfriedia acidiceleris]|uniref:hypothetical protein n=1 Tax=Gottfriedia acidiceleris TaxID=371036 RepID=UPI000B4425D2|nr:hypothetical protein [Gottfriedia acidiceleris]